MGVAGLTTTAPSVGAAPPDSVEVSGANRYGTAADAATTAYPSGAATVVLTTGEDFPDALAANSLAGANDGPILLTRTDALPAETSAALTTLAPTTVIVVGGEAAVSAAVEAELVADGYTVERVFGANRFETANEVAAEVGTAPDVDAGAGPLATAVLAYGRNFPDAVSVSPGLHKLALPLLLTDTDSLHESAQAATTTLGVEQVVIVGGTGVVSQAIEDALVADGINVVRLAGANRYETASEIVDFHLNVAGFDASNFHLATGLLFPDALAGGPLASVNNGPLALTGSVPPALATLLQALADQINTIWFLGGLGAIDQDTRDEVLTLADPTGTTTQDFAVTPNTEAILPVSTTAGPDKDAGRREYTADVGSDPVSIALFSFPLLEGEVFSDGGAGVSGDGRADGIGATTAVIETVNGVELAAPTDYVSDIAPSGGQVSFAIDSTTPNTWVWPVVFVDADNDDQLDLSEADTPAEDWGLGGPTLWIPEEAPFGLNETGRVQILRNDLAQPFFTFNVPAGPNAGDYTIYYQDSFTFEYASDQAPTNISFEELGMWLSGPAVDGFEPLFGNVLGDLVNVNYNANSSNSEVIILDDTPMAPQNLTGAAGDPDFDGFNDDAQLMWDDPSNPDIDSYQIWRFDQNSDGTFPPVPSAVFNEPDGSAFNDLNLPENTYLYVISTLNGQSGQRSVVASAVVVIVDEEMEPAPFSDDITFTATDADNALDGIDPGVPDLTADQFTVFFDTGSPIQVAANATIGLRGQGGQLVNLTNGSNATMTVGGLDMDELTVTLENANYTPNEDPFGNGPLLETDIIEIATASGITSDGGAWNLPRSRCDNEGLFDSCPVENQAAFGGGDNDSIPQSHEADPNPLASNIILDGVAGTMQVNDDFAGSAIQDGEPFALYDFASGEMLASGTFDVTDVPGTTVAANIQPGQDVLFQFTDNNTRQISMPTQMVVPNEVPEVIDVASSDNSSLDKIDLTWDEIVTLTGDADDIEIYDSQNANLVARGEAISAKTSTVFTVDLDANLVNGTVYWLRILSGNAQDADNNPNPDQAFQFLFLFVNDAPTVDSLTVDGSATTDGGTVNTNDSSPVVQGVASDTDGTITNVTWDIDTDGLGPQSATATTPPFDAASEPFSFTITGPLADGVHNLDVVAFDNDGGVSATWDVQITVASVAPTITGVATIPGTDDIRVTFSENVTCPNTANGRAAWVYDDQSTANNNDGSPTTINQVGGANTCDLFYAGLNVDDFGTLNYTQPAGAADQVQDTGGTPLGTVASANVVDSVAPTFNLVQNAAAGGVTVEAVFSEELLCASVEAADFTANVGGSARNIASVACAGTTVTITLEPPVLVAGQTVTIAYDSLASGGIFDLSGDNAAASATRAVASA